MEQALAQIDKTSEKLKKEQEKAIDLQIAAKEEFKRIQDDAQKISEAYIEKHHKEYKEQLRNEILLEVVRKLIANEIPSNTLRTWLELTPKMMADAWMYLGFEKLDDDHVGHVGYESSGRSGHVIFYREDRTARFPFEFAGGTTLAYITIPEVATWEQETGFSSKERKGILEFVAKRVIRDQASKCKYKITSNSIDIKY
jgi:hypothetical protein